jgi:hypothetical protein
MERSHMFLLACMVTACLALMTKKEAEPNTAQDYVQVPASLGPNSSLSISMDQFDDTDRFPGPALTAQFIAE